ncbi:tetratricopeptide repeat protein [Niabella drilacis]|uniref:Tetratricopeptide repeat-containing protein n=1 Tax=Niabella drilacis (strain DSM 25811 / CCM 8410 / CCUG 62505 / LMG 26954 / E90) TaxID=1285928 RepID=A0A1G6NNH5_NIADE|nr:tetratricopeptide repeat protein [Niabella drilacis]SDC69510.1 Tetratricopeptide repeat-containing protein [Niabella drilacis]
MKHHFLFLLSLITLPLLAQNGSDLVKKGNDYYREGKMNDAVKAYDKAIQGPHQYIALLNKGNALYRLKKYDDAVKTYQQAAASANTDTGLRSAAFYNTGVVYSSQNKLEESIEAYKNALRLNSNDVKARENLQKALLEKKKQGGGGGGGQNKKEESPKPSKSRLNQNQAQNQLDKLENKEKNTQQRISEDKSQYGTSREKDW